MAPTGCECTAASRTLCEDACVASGAPSCRRLDGSSCDQKSALAIYCTAVSVHGEQAENCTWRKYVALCCIFKNHGTVFVGSFCGGVLFKIALWRQLHSFSYRRAGHGILHGRKYWCRDFSDAPQMATGYSSADAVVSTQVGHMASAYNVTHGGSTGNRILKITWLWSCFFNISFFPCQRTWSGSSRAWSTYGKRLGATLL